MDLSFLTQYFVPVVVALCLCVGYVLHTLVPSEAVNRFIPLTVAVLGAVASCLLSGAVSVELVVAGMVSGLASTGLYEAFDQIINKGGLLPGERKDG